jgi:hypothetical protein
LTAAAASNDPQKLAEVMQRIDDPTKFINLWAGIGLEQEKQKCETGADASPIELIPAFHTEKDGSVVPEMEIFNTKTLDSKVIEGRKLRFKPAE